MRMKRNLFIAMLALSVVSASAQKTTEAQLAKEANAYFESGQYLKAFPLYSQLVSLHPQDATYNYKFGACAIFGQADKGQAIKHLSFATKKNVEEPMAWYFLGKAYHLNYQFRDAIQAYQEFDKMVDEKISTKTDVIRSIEMCQYGTGLLANMKDVVVMNKVESDRANFFRYMNLEDIGGKILALPAELKTKLDEKSTEPGVIHYPGNSTVIYFSSFGKDGSTGKDIYSAQILPDGKFSTSEKLQGGVNTKYDEDFSFMHSDGKTLFFASKGHNSMGGYDIFKCELDKSNNTFGPAVNLDFAINTPDDDIFYIADSLNRKAWFASGRTSDHDHLSVYNVFVEGIPLQITYLKGDFVSEINPDQKMARISVKETGTNRTVFDAMTSEADGRYILYIPKAGEYKFCVSTENSPVIHEGIVSVPFFDSPVALKQELKLVKEGGMEKLIITNYFESPLNEDLATLAADMLRKKAGLDVNATPEVMEALEQDATDDILVERTMQNAPLAAGFAESSTMESIIQTLVSDLSAKRIFVGQAENKSNLAYSYALKKKSEADAKLKQAELLRSTTNMYSSTDGDVEKLRTSVALSKEGESLQREAINAMAAAEATRQYAMSENEKLLELESATNALKSANSNQDFDQALFLLKQEKERQITLRGGDENPASELYVKAKAKEADEKTALAKLETLRDEEKKFSTDMRIAEQEMNASKKSKDKAKFESDYANAKASLDAKRREITQQTIKSEELGKQTEDLYGQARFFERLQSEKGNLGLNTSEVAALSQSEKNTLRMKLGEMETRIAALEIHDPQMLALLGEPVEAELGLASHTGQRKSLNEMMSARESTLSANNSPDVSRMVTQQSLDETNASISSLETIGSAISETEKSELEQLRNYRNNLVNDLAVIPAPPLVAVELRLAYNAATPGYDSQMQEINNMSGTALDRQLRMMNLKKETIENLEVARKENALAASSTIEPAALDAFAQNDARYTQAMNSLEKETSGVMPYRAAFDEGNRDIIENDEVAANKLRDQVTLSESYVASLENLRKETQEKISDTNDGREQQKLKNLLSEILNEQDAATIKLLNYRSDLDLTAAASDAPADTTAVVLNATPPGSTAEDEMEELSKDVETETEGEAHNEKGDEEPSDEEDDALVIQELFKSVKEEESIISYETGALDEIIAAQETDSLKVNNRERISEIQDEIFLAEAEMENAKSESKKRKLDREAEKLYFKKSLLEIQNSEAIGEMAKMEFDQTKETVDKFRKENLAKIDSRIMIRDEIRSLYNKAKDEMEDAAILRKKAGPVIDDIEKNDYYRRAFAKEMYAIRMLKKIQEIGDNLDMMLQYSDQELAALRYGKKLPPKPGEEVVLNADASDKSATAASEALANNTIKNAIADNTVPPKTTVTTPVTNPTASQPLNKPSEVKSPVNPPTSNKSIAATNQPLDNSAINKTIANSDAFNASAMEGNINSAPTKQANTVAENFTINDFSGNKTSTIATTSNPVNPDVTALTSEARASAGAYSPGEAANMYFQAPSSLSKDLFVFTSGSVYSDNAPIPVDGSMPLGIYYKVQVGAFRNNIPQNLFDEFAPVSGENIQNGVTRYTAGFFLSFSNADEAKKQIREIGYSDAFIVAYRDGKRIPLYDAMGKTEGENFMDLIESEYVHGDNAPKKEVVVTAELNTEYYNYRKHPDAARVTLVESVSGLFYTVQVGVYSQPVAATAMFNISPLNSELNDRKQVRYSSGIYTKMEDALNKRSVARQIGIGDAFVTAYYNGKRISLSEADKLLTQFGPSIMATGN